MQTRRGELPWVGVSWNRFGPGTRVRRCWGAMQHCDAGHANDDSNLYCGTCGAGLTTRRDGAVDPIRTSSDAEDRRQRIDLPDGWSAVLEAQDTHWSWEPHNLDEGEPIAVGYAEHAGAAKTA